MLQSCNNIYIGCFLCKYKKNLSLPAMPLKSFVYKGFGGFGWRKNQIRMEYTSVQIDCQIAFKQKFWK